MRDRGSRRKEYGKWDAKDASSVAGHFLNIYISQREKLYSLFLNIYDQEI